MIRFSSAALLLLAATIASPLQAEAKTDFYKAVQIWTKACQNDSGIKPRIGQGANRPSQQTIAAGIAALQRFGMADRLGVLRRDEACLALVASGTTHIPVIVVQKPISGDQQEGPGILSRAGKALYERMKRLNVGYSGATPIGTAPPKSASDNRYPRRNRLNRIRVRAMQGSQKPRGFAIGLSNHCLIGINTGSFQSFLQGLPVALQHAIPEADRQWLERRGEAMSFWHEVGHCAASPVVASGARPKKRNGEANSQTVDSCSAPTKNPYVNAPAITYTAEQKARIIRVVKGDRSNLNGIDVPSPSSEHWILTEVSKEVLADDYAIKAVRERFKDPEPPCQETVTITPWGRFRLVMSVYSPRPSRMNWVIPYITKAKNNVQRHKMLADAWDGLRQVAFEDFEGIPRPGQLMGTNNPGAGYIRVPSERPDKGRAEKWASWIRYWVRGNR